MTVEDDFSILRSLLQDLRDTETPNSLEHAHVCGLLTAADGFAALERIEKQVYPT